jgi:uracil-DNA glycosylase
MGSNNKQQALEAIREAITNLTDSPLYEYRVSNNYHPVIGGGSPDANIMIIGEAPGATEAKRGLPFVGASGRLLNELLESVGLTRDDVYITNVVKDRPPKNRDPHKSEIALYAPYLAQQIAIIQPKVIVTLGRFAMTFILTAFDMPEQNGKISELHGQVLASAADYGPVTIVPLYHPAVALHNSNQRQTLFDDIAILKTIPALNL